MGLSWLVGVGVEGIFGVVQHVVRVQRVLALAVGHDAHDDGGEL